MKSWVVLSVALLASACSSGTAARNSSPPVGILFVGGGGSMPEGALTEALDLAGGSNAHVVVVPMASTREERGRSDVDTWKKLGALSVVHLDDLAPTKRAAALGIADLIWLGGGSQILLMDELRAGELVDAVLTAHRRGALVGGTSAGAAVMSTWMITGDADLKAVASGRTELADGLGLWPGVIVDQHFLARRRNNRLITAVLDTGLVGIGIDERTAVFVHPDGSFRVVGESCVLVYNPKDAEILTTEPDLNHGAVGVDFHILRAGMTHQPAP